MGDTLTNILIIVGGLIVFVIFFLVPNQKKSKKEKQFYEALKLGDKVVSIGGIHGIIVDLHDTQVLLQMEDRQSQILLAKQAISYEATHQTYPPPTAKSTPKKPHKKAK